MFKEKRTTEQFIKDAKEKHGNKYDYSLVEYIEWTTKVKIICPKHGIFEQTPNQHFQSNGCNNCGIEKRISNSKTPTNKVIEDFRKVHNQKFDYRLMNYINSGIKIDIICLTCGIIFEQRPRDHKNGNGCDLCRRKKQAIEQLKSTEEFIEDAKKVHGNKFDYSTVDYVGAHNHIKIICPKHGIFQQKPSNHLTGFGCDKCIQHLKESKISKIWLEEIGVPCDEVLMKFKNEKKKRKVDGYDFITKTVYQFHGTFWHGHPDFYHPEDIHPITNKKFGKMYDDVLKKDRNIIDSGYKLIVIWEHEFRKKLKKLS